MTEPNDNILNDSQAPYRVRIYRPGWETFDPISLPWKEMRRGPAAFPDCHVAKVSRARTVIGLTFTDLHGAEHRIYVKRSLVRGPIGKLLSRFRESKEKREFELASCFERAGFIVPEPVYYSEAVMKDESANAVFYVTRALPAGWISAKDFFKAERRFDGEWKSLARFTALLHERGILHADYRSDHVFINIESLRRDAPIPESWALIDLDGSRCGRSVGAREREHALKQLAESLLTSGLTEADLENFIAVYDVEKRYRLLAKEIFQFAVGKQRKAGSGDAQR